MKFIKCKNKEIYHEVLSTYRDANGNGGKGFWHDDNFVYLKNEVVGISIGDDHFVSSITLQIFPIERFGEINDII